jgi:hypothetical protein
VDQAIGILGQAILVLVGLACVVLLVSHPADDPRDSSADPGVEDADNAGH